MLNQRKTRKILLGIAVIVIAAVALVVGVVWLPNWASTSVTIISTQGVQQSRSMSTVVLQMGRGEFILPVVDRNGFTGKSLSLSDFRGKVVVLEFMGPWCVPWCHDVVPAMERLYKQYFDRGVAFIAVAEPWNPTHTEYQNVSITQFLNRYNSSLTYVYDSEYKVGSMYGIHGIPILFVLSKMGPISATFDGSGPIQSVGVLKAVEEALGNLPTVLSQQTDPVGDTFNAQAQSTVTDNYIDITNVTLSQLGSIYIANITVAGPLPPTSPASTSIYVEWDVLLDLDQNNATHPWGTYPLIDNRIGVDAVARLTLYNGSYRGELLSWPSGKRTSQSIGFKVDGPVAMIYFDASMIGNPKSFDFVYVARKYAQPENTLIAADKAPNRGHFRFTNGSVITIANLVTAQSSLLYGRRVCETHPHRGLTLNFMRTVVY